jgi:hypothetical protein
MTDRCWTEYLPLLPEMVGDIVSLYPEATKISVVGSYARCEATPKSDLDILVRFPKDTDGWKMVLRDQPLWDKWRKKGKEVGVPVVDFIIQVEDGVTCGQQECRMEAKLPTPEIPIWKKEA